MSISVLELEGTAQEIRAQLPDFQGQRLRATIRPIEKVTVDEDLSGENWVDGISREWEADWLDPSEDIYNLEDGQPVAAAR